MGSADHWVGIVDDEPSLRRSLARVLRLEGIRVETFASGEEFLERFDRGAPDCLVLDVHLGGLTGFEVQDLLDVRGNPPPIIFITAHDEIPLSRLHRAGAPYEYLRKPFDPNALIARLLHHLDRAVRARSEADDARSRRDESYRSIRWG